MSSLNGQQKNILEAFVMALSQQDAPLPPAIQAQLQAIGHNIESRIVELPAIAASLPALNAAYQQALTHDQSFEGSQLNLSGSQEPDSELISDATKILTAPDPVQIAQSNIQSRSRQVASNPIKRLFKRG